MEWKSARIQWTNKQMKKANALDLQECRDFINRIFWDDELPDNFSFEETVELDVVVYKIHGPNDLVEEFKRKFMEIAQL